MADLNGHIPTLVGDRYNSPFLRTYCKMCGILDDFTNICPGPPRILLEKVRAFIDRRVVKIETELGNFQDDATVSFTLENGLRLTFTVLK